MTPHQTSSDLSNLRPALLDRAKQLAATLLSERGEASGALLARQLQEALRALDTEDRHGFQRGACARCTGRHAPRARSETLLAVKRDGRAT